MCILSVYFWYAKRITSLVAVCVDAHDGVVVIKGLGCSPRTLDPPELGVPTDITIYQYAVYCSNPVAAFFYYLMLHLCDPSGQSCGRQRDTLRLSSANGFWKRCDCDCDSCWYFSCKFLARRSNCFDKPAWRCTSSRRIPRNSRNLLLPAVCLLQLEACPHSAVLQRLACYRFFVCKMNLLAGRLVIAIPTFAAPRAVR